MAKQVTSFRASPEARECLARLGSTWGYEDTADAAEAALVCWEWTLTHAAKSVASKFTRAEWNMLADICNGTLWAYGHSGGNPGQLLALSAHDGHTLDGTGYRWLGQSDLPGASERAQVDTEVADLVRRLAALEYAEAWAFIRAICWFWQHPEIDHRVDEWWSVEFRRQYRMEGNPDASPH